MESYLFRSLYIVAAFGLLIGTFLFLSFVERHLQKWIGLALLIGMCVCWSLEAGFYLVVQAILFAAVLFRYVTNDRPKVRAVFSLIGAVLASYFLIVFVALALAVPVMGMLGRADVELPELFFDAVFVPWLALSLFLAWKLSGRRLWGFARNAIDILRDRKEVDADESDEAILTADP